MRPQALEEAPPLLTLISRVTVSTTAGVPQAGTQSPRPEKRAIRPRDVNIAVRCHRNARDGCRLNSTKEAVAPAPWSGADVTVDVWSVKEPNARRSRCDGGACRDGALHPWVYIGRPVKHVVSKRTTQDATVSVARTLGLSGQ